MPRGKKEKWSLSGAKRTAFKKAAAMARKHGVILKPFRRISEDDSQLGPEWVAFTVRQQEYVSVYFPFGEDEIETAKQNCFTYFETHGFVVAINGSIFTRRTGERQ